MSPKKRESTNNESAKPASKLPSHIAIIMDGNRRWAKKNDLSLSNAYSAGLNKIYDVCQWLIDIKIKTVTIFAFSSENWKRSNSEILKIKALILGMSENKQLKGKVSQLNDAGVKINFIGDAAKFGSQVESTISQISQQTQNNTKLNLVIALGYGGRSEITNAICNIVNDKIPKEKIDESLVEKYLETPFKKNPELLIRTGGHQRISNFLLWQIAYSELYFCQTLWPDFSREDLQKAITHYTTQERNFGK